MHAAYKCAIDIEKKNTQLWVVPPKTLENKIFWSKAEEDLVYLG